MLDIKKKTDALNNRQNCTDWNILWAITKEEKQYTVVFAKNDFTRIQSHEIVSIQEIVIGRIEYIKLLELWIV